MSIYIAEYDTKSTIIVAIIIFARNPTDFN